MIETPEEVIVLSVGRESGRRSWRGAVWLLSFLVLLLAGATLLQLLPNSKVTIAARQTPLEDYLPLQMNGWRGEDLPLGETEDITSVVKSTLNYDEALLRTYHKSGKEFSLYVAFWSAGKMSSREVAYHTPDICWPANGWSRLKADYRYTVSSSALQLAPAQYREFTLNGHRQYVLFWHTYNGHTIAYDPAGRPSRLSMLTDLLQRGLKQKGEQYFIRLTSPEGFSNLWTDDGFKEILELIAPLGPGLSSDLESFEIARD